MGLARLLKPTNDRTDGLSIGISRRAFLVTSAAAGGGMLVGFYLPQLGRAGAAPTSADIFAPNAFVRIGRDDSVTLVMPQVEMGQGTYTSMSMLIAEELEVDLSQVTLEAAPPNDKLYANPLLGFQVTGGSTSVMAMWEPLRRAGAVARVMLIAAAAAEWNVDPSSCHAEHGEVIHPPTGQTLKYGALVDAAAKLPVPASVTLKDPKDFTLIGTPAKRIDTPEKVNGKAVYGIDAVVPGMKFAAVAACPVLGGKLAGVDDSKTMAIKGVRQVVRLDNAVAVIGDSTWAAIQGLAALDIDWDNGPNATLTTADIIKQMDTVSQKAGVVARKEGDVAKALTGAARKVEAVYNYPYQNHACMEPMNATALYTDEKCEVWCGTQDGEGAFGAVVQTSGLAADKCDVHKVMLGGGFGRRGRADYIIQAVQIAKQMPGTPIKLLWTREEDMQHGFYHPITQCKMTGTFDKDNNLTGLHMRISGQSILATVFPSAIKDGKDPVTFQGLNPSGETAFGYSVPNLLIDHAMRNPHVPAGFWRGVNVNHNAIYVECFMDELAHSIGVDALEFRRKLMGKNPKNLAVLNAAAERIGWGKPAEKGRFRGLSQMMAFGSYVAGAAEISVDGDKIKIHKLIGATDPGFAVNPAQIERQVAGSFVYGLSALFYGECTVKDGYIEQTNFDTYNSLRIAEMPVVESICMPSGHTPWGGVGEPTILVAAPAVLNAYFNATGKRIRSFPLKNHNLQIA